MILNPPPILVAREAKSFFVLRTYDILNPPPILVAREAKSFFILRTYEMILKDILKAAPCTGSFVFS